MCAGVGAPVTFLHIFKRCNKIYSKSKWQKFSFSFNSGQCYHVDQIFVCINLPFSGRDEHKLVLSAKKQSIFSQLQFWGNLIVSLSVYWTLSVFADGISFTYGFECSTGVFLQGCAFTYQIWILPPPLLVTSCGCSLIKIETLSYDSWPSLILDIKMGSFFAESNCGLSRRSALSVTVLLPISLGWQTISDSRNGFCSRPIPPEFPCHSSLR